MYSQVEHWGPDEDEYRTGLICSIIATAHSAKKAFCPADFMRQTIDTPEVADTEQAMKAQCMNLAAVHAKRKALREKQSGITKPNS